MEKRLAAKERLTPEPGAGFNLVGVDTMSSDPDDELYLVASFMTRADAETAKKARLAVNPDEVLYIYGEE